MFRVTGFNMLNHPELLRLFRLRYKPAGVQAGRAFLRQQIADSNLLSDTQQQRRRFRNIFGGATKHRAAHFPVRHDLSLLRGATCSGKKNRIRFDGDIAGLAAIAMLSVTTASAVAQALTAKASADSAQTGRRKAGFQRHLGGGEYRFLGHSGP